MRSMILENLSTPFASQCWEMVNWEMRMFVLPLCVSLESAAGQPEILRYEVIKVKVRSCVSDH